MIGAEAAALTAECPENFKISGFELGFLSMPFTPYDRFSAVSCCVVATTIALEAPRAMASIIASLVIIGVSHSTITLFWCSFAILPS